MRAVRKMTRSKPALTSATAATSPSAVGLSVRRSSVVQGAKRFLFKKELKEKQVGLVTTAAVKNRTTRVLLITLFIDISGVALLSPCYPSMCANAPGAADLGEVPGAFPASNFAFAAQATAPNTKALIRAEMIAMAVSQKQNATMPVATATTVASSVIFCICISSS